MMLSPSCITPSCVTHRKMNEKRVPCSFPEDQTIFRPPLKQSIFSLQTPLIRMLTCPTCGKKSYCLEVCAPESRPEKVGKYLVWGEESGRR